MARSDLEGALPPSVLPLPNDAEGLAAQVATLAKTWSRTSASTPVS